MPKPNTTIKNYEVGGIVDENPLGIVPKIFYKVETYQASSKDEAGNIAKKDFEAILKINEVKQLLKH